MTETVRALVAAAVLSASAFATLAWHITRTDATRPERLIGELRLAQWAAVLLAAIGATSIGLAAARADVPTGTVDVAAAVVFVLAAGLVLLSEPRAGLLVAAFAFVGHALFVLGHRPGWLSAETVPRWYISGAAAYDLALAAVCFWARRR